MKTKWMIMAGLVGVCGMAHAAFVTIGNPGMRRTPALATTANYEANGNYTAWAVGSGLQEQNGTFDMMGNVWEWMEDADGGFLGGSYEELSFYQGPGNTEPSAEFYSFGFRVVEVGAVPEPSTALLLAAGGCIAWLARLKQRF